MPNETPLIDIEFYKITKEHLARSTEYLLYDFTYFSYFELQPKKHLSTGGEHAK